MRAYGYLRISKETPDTTSPIRQREAIEQLCAARGWELVEVFSDVDVSAYQAKHRPAFDAMIGRLSDTDAIVFWRLDRLARSVRQLEDIADECERSDVQLVSTDGEIDTTSAAGRAFYQMRGVFGEFESRNLSERSRAMMRHKKDRNEWVGRVPFGWALDDKHLVVDPAQQEILRDAARRFVRGESFSEIGRRHALLVSPLSRMLASERVQGVLPPDLAGELALALKTRRMQRVPTSRQSLLGGIAVCVECGGGMVLASTRGGRRGRWGQYRCPKAGHVGIAARWLEDYVTGRVIDMVDTTKLVDEIRARRATGRTRKASEIEARMELLDQMFTDGKMTKPRYERANADLVDRLAAAQSAERVQGIDLPAELARELGNRWEGLDVAARRRIIRAVLQRIEVHKATGHGPISEDRVMLVWRLGSE
jgi:DNA invertase Pin-like site-specific DNA recombinase